MRSLLIAGVLLLMLLTFYSALWFKSETIEEDITNRVTEDLNAAGAKDIEIGVDGRHVTLSGVVYDASTEGAYLGTADDTYGALGPIDGLTLRDGTGFLKAVKSPDGITLTGAVPSEEARLALLEAATAGTEGNVTDAMTVGAAEGAWTDEAGFGLSQMAGLTAGTLSATPDSYTLSGTTDGDAAALSATLAERTGWQSFVSAPKVQNDMDGEIIALRSELTGLEDQVETLTADLGARDETVAGLTADLGARDETVAGLTADLGVRDETVAGLTADLSARDETVAGLTTERDTLAASLAAMTLSRDTAIDQTDASTAELIAQRDALATDLEGARIKSGVQSDTIAGLSTENDTLQQALATVTSERDTVQADLENLRTILDNTQSSTAALRAQLSDAQGQLSDTKGQLSDAQGQVAERDVTIEGLTGEVADLTDQLANQTASLNANAQDDAALRAQIAEQSGTIETLTANVDARGETILRLQGENDTLAEGLDAKIAMVTERDATVAALEASLASAGSGATTAANVEAPAGVADQCSARAGEVLQTAQINFSSGTANIRNTSVQTLERLTGIALACAGSGLSVEIGGHTDSQGSDGNNQQLSERRAQAVAQFMVDRGVPAGALQPVGYGEAQPIGDNATAEGRQANRRISFEWQAR